MSKQEQSSSIDNKSTALNYRLIRRAEEERSQRIAKVQKERLYTALKEAFPDLTKTEARIMKLRYGLTGGKPLEYHQIAANDGTSKAVIANIHDDAVTKLKQHEPLAEIAKQYQSDRTVQSAFTTYRGPTPDGALLENIFENLTPEEKEAPLPKLPPEPKNEAIELFVRQDIYVKTQAKDAPNQTTVEKPKRKMHFPQIKAIFDAADEKEQEELLARLTKRQREVFDAHHGGENGPRSRSEAVRLVGNSSKSFSRLEQEILVRFSTIPSNPEQKKQTLLEQEYAQLTQEEKEILKEILPQRQAEIMEARFGQGLTQAETASLLQIRLKNVQNRENIINNKIKKIKQGTKATAFRMGATPKLGTFLEGKTTEEIDTLLTTLTPEDAELVRLRFFSGKVKKQKDVADLMGVKKGKVSRNENKILKQWTTPEPASAEPVVLFVLK